MPQLIQLKRSDTAKKVPLVTDLSQGELAINVSDGKIYFKSGSDDNTANIIEVITANAEISQSVYLAISASENVGIGTTTPGSKLEVIGDISASGTIYANNFHSAGGDEAGISFTDQVNVVGDITSSGNISASGTLIANAIDIEGNVSFGSISSSGDIKAAGYVSASNLISSGHITASGNISSSAGNVYALEFHGDGSNLTNIPAGTSTTHLSASLDIKAAGYMSASNLISSGHITASGNISSSATITANAFVGDGSALTNLSAGTTFTHISASLDAKVAGYVSASNLISSGHITASNNISASGNLISKDLYIDDYLYHTGNTDTKIGFPTGDKIDMKVGDINFFRAWQKDSDVDKFYFSFNNDPIDFIFRTAANNPGLYVSASGKVSIGGTPSPENAFTVYGDISASGFVSASHFSGDGSGLINLPAGGITSFTHISASLDVKAEGYVSASNLISSGHITASGNISSSSDLSIFGEVVHLEGTDPRLKLKAKGANHPGVEWHEDTTRKWVLYNDPDENDNLTFKNDSTELIKISQSGDLFIPRKLIHEGDSDTFIDFTDDDINIKVGNINFMDFTQDTVSELTINESAQDLDVRIEGEADANLFFTDASTSNVGIGTITPSKKLTVTGEISASGTITAPSYNGVPIMLGRQAQVIVNPVANDFYYGNATQGFFHHNHSGKLNVTTPVGEQLGQGNQHNGIIIPCNVKDIELRASCRPNVNNIGFAFWVMKNTRASAPSHGNVAAVFMGSASVAGTSVGTSHAAKFWNCDLTGSHSYRTSMTASEGEALWVLLQVYDTTPGGSTTHSGANLKFYWTLSARTDE